MTPQMQKWLRAFVGNERYVLTSWGHNQWEAQMWDDHADDDFVAHGFGPTPDAAELDALEEYARRTFVPGALEHGRMLLGLPKRRRAS